MRNYHYYNLFSIVGKFGIFNDKPLGLVELRYMDSWRSICCRLCLNIRFAAKAPTINIIISVRAVDISMTANLHVISFLNLLSTLAL